jgi:hypothetical protein
MKTTSRTQTARWENAADYNPAWLERSRQLLDLFRHSSWRNTRPLTVSEFGCGPYAPCERLLAEDPLFTVRKYDIKAWDERTTVLDLNALKAPFAPADIAIFSGVLEYLDDVPDILHRAGRTHQFLLLSYAFLPAKCRLDDARFLKIVAERTKKRGWRNHLTNAEIVAHLSAVGTIEDVDLWDGRQALFFAASRFMA